MNYLRENYTFSRTKAARFLDRQFSVRTDWNLAKPAGEMKLGAGLFKVISRRFLCGTKPTVSCQLDKEILLGTDWCTQYSGLSKTIEPGFRSWVGWWFLGKEIFFGCAGPFLPMEMDLLNSLLIRENRILFRTGDAVDGLNSVVSAETCIVYTTNRRSSKFWERHLC